jgi:hypothetical protein
VIHTPREIVLDSAQTPAEIEEQVSTAMENGGVLALSDERGRRVIVPTALIAYIEIAQPDARRVGFVAG